MELRITDIRAREILDSRATPTVEAAVWVENTLSGEKCCGRASVPSGASTGTFEAVELRDGGTRYNGKGVMRAVEHVNTTIRESLLGMNALEQILLDKRLCELDGTGNKARLGANATLSVSLAAARACSHALHIPLWRYLGGVDARVLPVPMMNILNGGKHADNTVDFQEFMIMPLGAASFRDALCICSEIYHALKNILKEQVLSTGVGDEGGFAPSLPNVEAVLDTIVAAITKAGYHAGKDIFIALDAAANELYRADTDSYYFEGESKASGKEINRTRDEMIALYEKLCSHYPIISIEDGLMENDWGGFKELTARLGKKVQLVGDDLFVTNPERLLKGIQSGCANAILVKVNQIGTLSEAMTAIHMAKTAGYNAIISHRSGETEDSFIADLAVAVGSGQIKTGAPCRSDRVAKYNRLLAIEESLSSCAVYGSRQYRAD